MINKLRLILFSVALVTGISLAQVQPESYSALITLDDSTLVTDSTALLTDLFPTALLVNDDSLDVAFSATFELSFGTSSTRRWYKVRDEDSSYTVVIPTDTTIIKLDPDVFKSFAGVVASNQFDTVWIRFRASKAQDGDQKFYIRQGYK